MIKVLKTNLDTCRVSYIHTLQTPINCGCFLFDSLSYHDHSHNGVGDSGRRGQGTGI